MRSPFGKFRNEGGGREFFLSLHREQEEGHRGCSHLVACCRASAAAVQRGSAFPVSPSVAEAARRKRQRGSACSGSPHPFPPGDLRNRAPSRHLLAGGPAMARRCHLCSGPLPPVLGARALRSQHGPSSHRTTSVGCSPHHCCSIFSPLPGPVAPSDAAHKGEASQECLGERAACWGVSCRRET